MKIETDWDAEKRKALDKLQRIFTAAKTDEFISSLDILREIACCLDNLMFQGRLSSRCILVLKKPYEMDSRDLGETRPLFDCKIHRKTKMVEIWINLDHSKAEHYQNSFMAIVETLLHEMCHAIIDLDVDRSVLSCFESIVHFGTTGHGALFE